MVTLVYKEFVQMKIYLLQMFGFLIAASLIMGRIEPSMARGYLAVFPVIAAMTVPQMSFALEERGNTFAFLRALPIWPWEIVGAKYIVSFLVTLAFEGLLWIFGILYMPMVGGMSSVLTISLTTFIALLLASISLLLHFWLGLKGAKTMLLILVLILGTPAMLIMKAGRDVPGLIPAESLKALVEFGSSAEGIIVSLLVGLILMAASFSLSAHIFSRRDLSMI